MDEKNFASEAKHRIYEYVVQENTLFQKTNFEEKKTVCLPCPISQPIYLWLPSEFMASELTLRFNHFDTSIYTSIKQMCICYISLQRFG